MKTETYITYRLIYCHKKSAEGKPLNYWAIFDEYEEIDAGLNKLNQLIVEGDQNYKYILVERIQTLSVLGQ